MASIVEQRLALKGVLRLHLPQEDGVVAAGVGRDDPAIDKAQAPVEDRCASDGDMRGNAAEVVVPLFGVAGKADGEVFLITGEKIYREDATFDQGIVHVAAVLNADQD